MGLLQVLGPVMVGPSSSHTLGAMRIARFARKFSSSLPREVVFLLHGSFAKTADGHGTKKALLAGILDLDYDDERIVESYELARRLGLKFSFESVDLRDVHPNTVRIRFLSDEWHEIEGCSIGGGSIKITRVDEVECELGWNYDTLIILNKDEPGALMKILSCIEANIANLYLRRINMLQQLAVAILELDESRYDAEKLGKLDVVLKHYFVPKDRLLGVSGA
ncbi:L-serine ammonia-lyase, iron-sulfur-dependent subunit beta [Thermotoga caldifontis]|uniref:L-serine ammonia-lyase, iron-sulfur-dependent subunit beta n=1 Tax=Thermotoga caldifontis TaxID=1508419 RepID=UPI000596E539|nr:L-serine ammonia-lyase, iron-sulfur-dependent subunit beta [Thermotoga caldifontis]